MDFTPGPIIRKSLPQNLLDRIGKAFSVLRDIILVNEQPLCLEQFEIMFMRDINPEKDVIMWEEMAETYRRCIDLFPNDINSRRVLFQIILMLTMGLVDSKASKRQDVKVVAKVYWDVKNEGIANHL